MIKLAINGFGRIGRLAFKVALNYPREIRVVAINTSKENTKENTSKVSNTL